MKFDVRCEYDRLMFIKNRDGRSGAYNKACELIKTYLEASLKTRIKYKTRKYPYRRAYIEGAWSARYLIRNGCI